MFPKYTTIDTLKIARQQFKFNSNKLNYIAQYLGIGKKITTEFGLWKDVLLKNDRAALGKMIEYCKQDVLLLEDVYTRLKNHAPHKTHYGVVFNQDRGTCPECGSSELIKNLLRTTAAGIRYIQYRCKTCGKFHQKIDK
jgi:DNA-directed RNA polymerase subunit RPC12/RpoP